MVNAAKPKEIPDVVIEFSMKLVTQVGKPLNLEASHRHDQRTQPLAI